MCTFTCMMGIPSFQVSRVSIVCLATSARRINRVPAS